MKNVLKTLTTESITNNLLTLIIVVKAELIDECEIFSHKVSNLSLIS